MVALWSSQKNGKLAWVVVVCGLRQADGAYVRGAGRRDTLAEHMNAKMDSSFVVVVVFM